MRKKTNNTKNFKKKKTPKLLKVILLLLVVLILAKCISSCSFGGNKKPSYLKDVEIPAWIDVQIIDKGDSSRSGKELEKFRNIVIHYVANPGSTAQQNRDYFNSSQSSVSSHFVVGLQGEIIQCVPLNERSAASNDRNIDTISIEVCHPDESGAFNQRTYESLIKLTAWLCDIGKLKAEDVIRHYDVTGKECPLYYVKHEDAWLQMKNDIQYGIENYDFKEMNKAAQNL